MYSIAHDHSTPNLISIVAPAYNEEDGLEEFVRHLDAVMISGAAVLREKSDKLLLRHIGRLVLNVAVVTRDLT
jgi:hypothetical protein